MNLEQIVCTLEQAKYFKEHGLFQNSLFAWSNYLGDGNEWCWDVVSVDLLPSNAYDDNNNPLYVCNYTTDRRIPDSEYLLAPTAEEILERLPVEFSMDGIDGLFTLHITNGDGEFLVSYEAPDINCIDTYGETLTEALANMYIHLFDKKIIKS